MAKILLNEGSIIETSETKEKILDLIKLELIKKEFSEKISTDFINIHIKSCILKGEKNSGQFSEEKETLINFKCILFIY